MTTKTIEQRKAILQIAILHYVKKGWQLVGQFETSAQLKQEYLPSFGVALLLSLVFLLPAILYVIFYRGTKTLFIEVDEQGEVWAKTTDN